MKVCFRGVPSTREQLKEKLTKRKLESDAVQAITDLQQVCLQNASGTYKEKSKALINNHNIKIIKKRNQQS